MRRSGSSRSRPCDTVSLGVVTRAPRSHRSRRGCRAGRRGRRRGASARCRLRTSPAASRRPPARRRCDRPGALDEDAGHIRHEHDAVGAEPDGEGARSFVRVHVQRADRDGRDHRDATRGERLLDRRRTARERLADEAELREAGAPRDRSRRRRGEAPRGRARRTPRPRRRPATRARPRGPLGS